MSGEAIQKHREGLFFHFPPARAMDHALQTSSNRTPLFYLAKSSDADLRGCWWALGRLGPELEKQFSLSGEVLFLFTPYDDLQRRTFNAIVDRLREEVAEHQKAVSGSARFTPDPNLALLWSPDPSMRSKLEAWNEEGASTLVAEIPFADQLSPVQSVDKLRESILRVLSSRDLYRGRNPVTGNDFFGRQETLQQLRTELYAGRSIGLFGLRRSGKTSVVKEFSRRYRNQNIALIASDLEAVGELQDFPVQIGADMTNLLRSLQERDSNVWVGSEQDQRVGTFADLSTRLVRVAEKNRGYKFVLAIDEIESLSSFAAANPSEVRLFLGSLRRCAQTVDNVSLLLTGVTTKFFSEALLDAQEEVENPMFGFVDEVYLRPFSTEETINLVRKLGRSMMLEWNEDALELLNSTTGGFPFLVRDLASSARALARQRGVLGNDGRIVIDGRTLETAISVWRESAFELWTNIVLTLQKHHPLMAEMLRASSDAELADWIGIGGEGMVAARNLSRLGMLDRVGDTYTRAEPLVAMQALGAPSIAPVEHLVTELRQQTQLTERIQQLSLSDESSSLEFKSVVRINTHTGKADDEITKACLKTIAGFANCQGGTLLIGVSDDNRILGIDSELKTFPQARDGYERFIRDKANVFLSGAAGVDTFSVDFVSVDQGTVCVVEVQESPQPVWYSEREEDIFFVREGNRTIKLTGPTLLQFLARRFPTNDHP